ncbi:uncharacterized protein F4807DRAFT_463956 [Annulohypoxylon truncatum]|uniref:uncharacterized protein n=1 Tax=Annulohypoxylon truncatum TaxID=327061 RepID=UPI002007BE0B|nr:uncharacterized protein F4807DRAFT_463956 [Annulohypoxylon truncatum]KAI1206191.1 hypothetical protein F4807DRAFT_463956 [Annulohypoxylon truncatum]
MANRREQRIDLGGSGCHGEPVFNIFTDYLQPESCTTAAQVATRISLLAPPTNDGNKLWEFLDYLWSSICKFAEQIPHDNIAQDKLVDAILELMLLPDTGIDIWCMHMWEDLPLLYAAFSEHINLFKYSDFENIQLELDKEWIRFYAFGARLTAADVFSHTLPIAMVSKALEGRKKPCSSRKLNRDLSTAAVCIDYAGLVLVEELASNPHPVPDDDNEIEGGPLFKGKPGLTLERWLFWEKRFPEEAEKATTSEAKELALRAARSMKIWRETRLEGI